MPIGPKGQKRPADVIGNAVRVMRIATGEEADDVQEPGITRAEVASKGGKARASKLAAKRRTEIASKAAKARWPARAAPSEKETLPG